MHEVLEEIDFSNYNLDEYDLSLYMKNKILAFLESDLIRNNINNSMYKEYEFIDLDDESVSQGVIDLLIDGEEVLIVDYKLKNLDDEAYQKQLNGYRKVIEKKTDKIVRCFLYSLLEEKFIEVLQ